MAKRTFLDFEQPDRGTRKQDRRTALCADRIGGRHLRRDRPAEQEEPAAHQGHLQRPDALADHQDRAPSGAPVHARLRQRDLHRLRRAARRPPFLGRPVDRRRPGALQRHALHGAGPPEGPRHQGAHRAQLRHEQARGLPQGAAADEDRREVQAAGVHLRRHAGRLSRASTPRSAASPRPSAATSSRWRSSRCRSSSPSSARAAPAARWRSRWATRC